MRRENLARLRIFLAEIAPLLARLLEINIPIADRFIHVNRISNSLFNSIGHREHIEKNGKKSQLKIPMIFGNVPLIL